MSRITIIFITTMWLLGFPSHTVGGKTHKKGYVVLLHGLGRTANSFSKMKPYLEKKGYQAVNINYPSRKHDIQSISNMFVKKAIDRYCIEKDLEINFVTHSMGGVVIRYFLKKNKIDNLGRVVMLSPPNKGSEVVDFFKDTESVKDLFGPSFMQLGTDSASFVNIIGDTDYEVGIIAGSRSFNWINSIIIPGKDDGKVSVENAKLKNMKDFMVVERTHALIMRADEVLEATANFLEYGRFSDKEKED